MKLRNVQRLLLVVGLLVFLPLGIGVPSSWGGPLRITMNDGTSVEVPYFWEEGGEVKFEISGGVVGVPKSEVASIHEVLAAREFDPEAMVDTEKAGANAEQHRILQNLVAAKAPERRGYEKLTPQEGARLLNQGEMPTRQSRASTDRVHAPKFKVEGSFNELVKAEGNAVMLLIRDILSSRTDLSSQSFTLTLYDGEGNILMKKPCEVQRLNTDNKTLRDLNMRGHLFVVSSTVKPDPKIKRYEIIAVPR